MSVDPLARFPLYRVTAARDVSVGAIGTGPHHAGARPGIGYDTHQSHTPTTSSECGRAGTKTVRQPTAGRYRRMARGPKHQDRRRLTDGCRRAEARGTGDFPRANAGGPNIHDRERSARRPAEHRPHGDRSDTGSSSRTGVGLQGGQRARWRPVGYRPEREDGRGPTSERPRSAEAEPADQHRPMAEAGARSGHGTRQGGDTTMTYTTMPSTGTPGTARVLAPATAARRTAPTGADHVAATGTSPTADSRPGSPCAATERLEPDRTTAQRPQRPPPRRQRERRPPPLREPTPVPATGFPIGGCLTGAGGSAAPAKRDRAATSTATTQAAGTPAATTTALRGRTGPAPAAHHRAHPGLAVADRLQPDRNTAERDRPTAVMQADAATTEIDAAAATHPRSTFLRTLADRPLPDRRCGSAAPSKRSWESTPTAERPWTRQARLRQPVPGHTPALPSLRACSPIDTRPYPGRRSRVRQSPHRR